MQVASDLNTCIGAMTAAMAWGSIRTLSLTIAAVRGLSMQVISNLNERIGAVTAALAWGPVAQQQQADPQHSQASAPPLEHAPWPSLTAAKPSRAMQLDHTSWVTSGVQVPELNRAQLLSAHSHTALGAAGSRGVQGSRAAQPQPQPQPQGCVQLGAGGDFIPMSMDVDGEGDAGEGDTLLVCGCMCMCVFDCISE